MDRKKNESYLSFSKRVTRALSNKTISYKEWAKSLLNENIYGEENTRRCFVFFEKFLFSCFWLCVTANLSFTLS